MTNPALYSAIQVCTRILKSPLINNSHPGPSQRARPVQRLVDCGGLAHRRGEEECGGGAHGLALGEFPSDWDVSARAEQPEGTVDRDAGTETRGHRLGDWPAIGCPQVCGCSKCENSNRDLLLISFQSGHALVLWVSWLAESTHWHYLPLKARH